jgi:diadenosine tetraphosphatase ApaH/serine/threonine PP2A family protein phosphatase
VDQGRFFAPGLAFLLRDCTASRTQRPIAVLIALFTDIHGNREAFEACLAHAREQPIDRYVFLGDFVGYGADPGFVIDTVREFAARGAVTLRGNHDSAAIGHPERMNDDAMLAIAWTRRQLTPDQLSFLQNLPFTDEEDDRLYVHASAATTPRWDYVLEERAAARSFAATEMPLTFCGHTHVPALFHMTAAAKVTGFDPDAGVAVPLDPQRRWLAVIGAVGQPRDHNPDACYALYDDGPRTLNYVRVPYDVGTAQKKIRDAGLPEFLSARLTWGRGRRAITNAE